VKERLSKLQNWILTRCLENKEQGIARSEAREFFGKKFSEKLKWYRDVVFDYHQEGKKLFDKEGLDINDYEFFIARNGIGEEFDAYRPKKEKCSTRSIEASIPRSFNNLIKRELLTKKYSFGQHFLTEAGFLKVNRNENSKTVNTYEKYVNAINRANEEMKKHYKKLIGDLRGIMAKTKTKTQTN
jgi:hypothetical protein